MEETFSRKDLWNEGGKAGVVLGLVSVVYMFLTQWISGIHGHAFLSGFLNFVLWAAKFAICIWLMVLFMRRFAADFHAGNSGTFKFGCIVALCSALVYAAVSLANVLIISSEYYSTQMEAALSAYSGALDANSSRMLDGIRANLPRIVFFSNLIYCALFGVILSYILSRSIPPRNALAEAIDMLRRTGNMPDSSMPGSVDRVDNQEDATVTDAKTDTESEAGTPAEPEAGTRAKTEGETAAGTDTSGDDGRENDTNTKENR